MLRYGRSPDLLWTNAGLDPPARRQSAPAGITRRISASRTRSPSTDAAAGFSASPIPIRENTLAGEPDEAVLNWAHAHGTPLTDEECHVWNRLIAKLGLRDERSHVLPQRIQESGLTGKPIEALIDHIEFDEGLDPVATRVWEKI